MSCPEGQRRIDAFCLEKHVECDVGGMVPGTFYYKTGGKCERDESSINREYTRALKGGKCPDGQVIVGKSFCQDPCPKYYRARKGACELRKCIIRTDKLYRTGAVMCPEGSFPAPMASM